MKAADPSVSSILVRALVDVVERAGVSRAALLDGAAIDPRRLAQTIDRIDLETFARLQVRALDLTGDEALGLHMAEHTSEAAFDLAAHLVAHAPTLRAAVELCSRFERLFMDGAWHGEASRMKECRKSRLPWSAVVTPPRAREQSRR